MIIGEILLSAALVCILCDFSLQIMSGWRKKGYRKLSLSFMFASFAFAASALLLLVYFFLSNNFSIQCVYQRSSSNLEWYYKISAAWSGQSGSLFLWSTLLLAVYSAFRYSAARKGVYKGKLVFILFAGISALFLSMTMISHPFADLGYQPTDGLGLNPLLKSSWNLPHPPSVFAAFACLTVPFTIAVSKLYGRQTQGLDDIQEISVRLSWLFLSLGLLFGGAWAYEVGWGGYWSWDPVETGLLIPWLVCAAYFHGKQFPVEWRVKEFTMASSFFFIIFLAYIARGGGYSVHAHGQPTSSPGFEAALILIFLLIILPFFISRLMPRGKTGATYDEQAKFSMVSYFLLFLLILICFVGVAYPVLLYKITGVQTFMRPEFYETLGFPVVMMFALILAVRLLIKHFKISTTAIILISVLTVSSLFALGTVWAFPSNNIYFNFGLPILTFTAATVLCDLLRNLRLMKHRKLHFPKAFTHITHIAIILLLIGAIASSEVKETFQAPLAPGQSVHISHNIQVKLDDAFYAYKSGSGNFEADAHVTVYEGSRIIGSGTVKAFEDPHWGPRTETYILRDFRFDIYIVLLELVNGTGGSVQAIFELSFIPLISLVWMGSAILIVTIFLSIIFYKKRTLDY
jgi:cytochrome c-type biogenesis protein CcmF